MHSRSRKDFVPTPIVERYSLNQSQNPQKTAARRSLIVPIVIAIAAVALIVFSLTGGDNDSTSAAPTPPSTGQDDAPENGTNGEEDFQGTPEEPSEEEKAEMFAELAELAKREENDPLSMGDIDAPMTMIVYSDYRCPFCGQWERTTFPTLVEKYVDTGQMRVEWRDMPVLGDASVDAAHAARAAANQDKFWEFTTALYAEDFQGNAKDSDYEPETMADMAEELGMDRAKFLADLEAGEFEQDVDANRSEAWSIGFTGTPAFLIEGVPVIGAQPLETFEGAIQYRSEQLQGNN